MYELVTISFIKDFEDQTEFLIRGQKVNYKCHFKKGQTMKTTISEAKSYISKGLAVIV